MASHLQRLQNYAARVILRLPTSSNITTHLRSLHLLPVKVRSTYKIACLCYHCHSNTAQSYIADMLQKSPSHTSNTRSSLCTMPLLNGPAHSKATLGDRSLSFAFSSVWNSISNEDRCAQSLSSSMYVYVYIYICHVCIYIFLIYVCINYLIQTYLYYKRIIVHLTKDRI